MIFCLDCVCWNIVCCGLWINVWNIGLCLILNYLLFFWWWICVMEVDRVFFGMLFRNCCFCLKLVSLNVLLWLCKLLVCFIGKFFRVCVIMWKKLLRILLMFGVILFLIVMFSVLVCLVNCWVWFWFLIWIWYLCVRSVYRN